MGPQPRELLLIDISLYKSFGIVLNQALFYFGVQGLLKSVILGRSSYKDLVSSLAGLTIRK